MRLKLLPSSTTVEAVLITTLEHDDVSAALKFGRRCIRQPSLLPRRCVNLAVDVQWRARLAWLLRETGHDAAHISLLPDGN
jgi:hypothetical protein